MPPSSSTTMSTEVQPATAVSVKNLMYTAQPSTPTQNATTDEADARDEADRRGRERRDRVEREADHAARRILRLARVARVPLILDAGLPEADPARHPAQEPRALGHARERLDGAARQQPEVARVGGDVDARHPPQDAVEERADRALEPRLAFAACSEPVDDVEAVAPLRHESRDHLGRILQVGVHEHDRVSSCGVEPGGQRRLVPEVARQAQQPDVRVPGREREHRRPRLVGRAVVHQHDLVAA